MCFSGSHIPYGCAAACGSYSQTFTSSGTFIVPPGVFSVRAFAVGGGAGGTSGHQSGGGGGYVSCGTLNVTGGDTIPIVVGAGGAGGSAWLWQSGVEGTEPFNGGNSSFGSLLSASGGQNQTAVDAGSAGGTGAGAYCGNISPYCDIGSYTGAGGTGGSDGEIGNSTLPSGSGQGIAYYTACLQFALFHQLTAGAGGAGGLCFLYYASWQASGGGGGVLLDGNGPSAGDGLLSSKKIYLQNYLSTVSFVAGNGSVVATVSTPYFGGGGKGFGAGGGGGGFAGDLGEGGPGNGWRYAGGNGTDGLVYVEWD